MRFKLNLSYGRMIRGDDRVVDKRGKLFRKVTSCALAKNSQIGFC